MKQTDACIIGKHSFQLMYEQVKRYRQKNNGSVSEAEDVFQDSLIALYKHACAGRLGSSIRLEAYFFTICKNLWRKELQKKGRTVELTAQHQKEIETQNQESIMVTEDRKKLLTEQISRIGSNYLAIAKLLRFG